MAGRRCFVGVRLPDDVAAPVAGAVRWATPDPPRAVRLARAPTFHLTLAFLGDVDPEELDAVGRRMAAAATGHRAHVVEVGGGGTFGRAGVVWAGVADPTGQLAALRADVAAACLPRPDDRPFQPHITVARTDVRRHRPTVDAIVAALDAIATPWTIDHVTLFGRGAGWYEELATRPLPARSGPTP